MKFWFVLITTAAVAGATIIAGRTQSPLCHYRAGGALPDMRCTPGVTDLHVRMNIEDAYIPARVDKALSTICAPGYATSVRPPSSYTRTLKAEQMRAYGAKGPPGAYQEDHLIPLELGGDPGSPMNLWPQPVRQARAKDRLENALHQLVCDRVLPLNIARGLMATDWRATARTIASLDLIQ